ncbi:sigma-70 family RNA polymerase sigma factor [Streptomyces sp. NPDC056525]|uniref:sigma-70 family RNA polymerase sigma factor n=1 Tax=unclassified Streptomyces TaxID=2593676 RepID=UPI003684686A
MKVLDEDRFAKRPEKRLLTAVEEVGLSVLLRGGADSVGVEPTAEELADLSPQDIRRRARACLIAHNQGLVHSIVRGYVDQGLEYEDLFQHGVLGLINAVRKYDPSQGNKVSTYATWWIRQSVSRAVADEGRAIRVPVYMHDLMHKVARTERQLLSAGRSLSAADIAVACDLPITKVEEIRRISRVTDSLDRVIGDGTSLGELVEARTALPSVEGTVLRSLADRDVHRFVALLPERYAYVVNRRIGLDGQEPVTLDVIGTELKVTRERVRQLEGQVLSVLRLALEAPAGDPHTALQSMLTDPRAGGNPVSGISRDLKSSKWSAGVAAMRAFHARKGHARPADDHVVGGFPLGAWAAEQRSIAGESGSGLPVHRKIILSMVGFRWKKAPDKPQQSPLRVPSRVSIPAMRAPHPSLPPAESVPLMSSDGDPSDTVDVPMPAASPVPQHTPVAAEGSSEDIATPQVMPETSPPQEFETLPAGGMSAEPDTRDVSDVLVAVADVHDTSVTDRYSGLWEEAIELPVTFDRSVRWMAHYVRLALSHALLAEILGPHPARAVDEAADGNRLPDRPVVQALHVLVQVLDSLKEQRLRPEDFFEHPSPALLGRCPRVYLSSHPPVKPEGRLALSQALKEFTPLDTHAELPASETPDGSPAEEIPEERAMWEEGAPRVTAEHPAGRTLPVMPTAEHRLQEAERQLRELEADVAQRVASARADERNKARTEAERETARQAAETRGEAARLLREAHEAADERVRNAQAEAEGRVREAQADAMRQGEALRRTQEQCELRIREVARAAGLRVATLEERLREGQAAAFQRITAAATLERETAERMRAVERLAEQRVSEAKETSRSRIAALEAQLAALRPAPPAPPATPQGPDPRKWWQRG